MNKTICYLIIAGCAFLAGARVHSLAQGPRSARVTLQTLKEQNQKLIEQQTATLEKLDDAEKQASQLRTFSMRS